jgi:hypothetical protein
MFVQTVATNFTFLLGSRYIYDLYYEKEAITKQLYDWLLKNGYADANLIAKWKKQGYEKVSYMKLLYMVFFFTNISKALLSEVHTDERDEFQQYLHMSSTARSDEGRPYDTMCQLWMPWMFIE